MDSIYKIYDFYSDEISLPAYKRVLKNISEKITRIKNFEKYLEQAVKNELSSKQTPMEPAPKYIREEMVPDWLKNRNREHEHQEKVQNRLVRRRSYVATRLKILDDLIKMRRKEPVGY